MRKLMPGVVAALTACAVGLPLAAQTPVDRTVATSATGLVEVSNLAGEVRVVAWDRPEVRVSGTLWEGAERLDVETSGERVRVEVVIPRGTREVRGSQLEVRVPSRKNVRVRGTSADVIVEGVSGSVDAQSTSGDVLVSGSPSAVRAVSTSGDVGVDATTTRVEAASTSGDVQLSGSARASASAESVSGDVQVSAAAPELLAKSVSGNVNVTAATRRLSASTVSGGIEVRGGRMQYGSFESVSGDVVFEASLEPDAAINVQSHSGDVVLALPGGLSAAFQVSTFSGEIGNAFGAAAQRISRYGPGQELRFSTGNGGALITVKTFSGDVELQRRN